ncbi:MAG: ParA family protein [Mariprofundales bacterium]
MIISTISTKGGVGKTTLTANLAGYFADKGYKVLLLDADIQPTLSSYYTITNKAPAGLTEMLTLMQTDNIISHASDAKVDIIYSNDPQGKLANWLLHRPDGRMRMRTCLKKLQNDYDFIIIDTQGAAGMLLEAAIIASDLLLAPIPPEILSAREFARGTARVISEITPLFEMMNIPIPPVKGVLYRVDRSKDARLIAEQLRSDDYSKATGITVLKTQVPYAKAYKEAASQQVPVHQHEPKRRNGAQTPCAAEIMAALAQELV